MDRTRDRRPHRPGRIPRSSRGVALIAVLWVVLLLSVIAGSLLMLTRTELGLSRNLVLSARAEALAEGGIHLAIYELLTPGSTIRTQAGGSQWQVEMEAGLLDISVADVTGRIDLNAAPPAMLAGLLTAAGLDLAEAEALADRIADWRDPDDNVRPNGAEQADYAGYQPPIRVGNGPFLSADEILRIPGVTAQLWEGIADAVTVYSRRPGINPMHAPKAALRALPGVDDATADAIIATRSETDPDGSQQRAVAEIAGMLPAEARRYLTGGPSTIYAIRARAELPEGAIYILEAIIEMTPAGDPPWLVHEWRAGTPPSN